MEPVKQLWPQCPVIPKNRSKKQTPRERRVDVDEGKWQGWLQGAKGMGVQRGGREEGGRMCKKSACRKRRGVCAQTLNPHPATLYPKLSTLRAHRKRHGCIVALLHAKECIARQMCNDPWRDIPEPSKFYFVFDKVPWERRGRWWWRRGVQSESR